MSSCKYDHTPSTPKCESEYVNIQMNVIRRNSTKDFGPIADSLDINYISSVCSDSIDYAYDANSIEKIARQLAQIRIEDSK